MSCSEYVLWITLNKYHSKGLRNRFKIKFKIFWYLVILNKYSSLLELHLSKSEWRCCTSNDYFQRVSLTFVQFFLRYFANSRFQNGLFKVSWLYIWLQTLFCCRCTYMYLVNFRLARRDRTHNAGWHKYSRKRSLFKEKANMVSNYLQNKITQKEPGRTKEWTKEW